MTVANRNRSHDKDGKKSQRTTLVLLPLPEPPKNTPYRQNELTESVLPLASSGSAKLGGWNSAQRKKKQTPEHPISIMDGAPFLGFRICLQALENCSVKYFGHVVVQFLR